MYNSKRSLEWWASHAFLYLRPSAGPAHIYLVHSGFGDSFGGCSWLLSHLVYGVTFLRREWTGACDVRSIGRRSASGRSLRIARSCFYGWWATACFGTSCACTPLAAHGDYHHGSRSVIPAMDNQRKEPQNVGAPRRSLDILRIPHDASCIARHCAPLGANATYSLDIHWHS